MSKGGGEEMRDGETPTTLQEQASSSSTCVPLVKPHCNMITLMGHTSRLNNVKHYACMCG